MIVLAAIAILICFIVVVSHIHAGRHLTSAEIQHGVDSLALHRVRTRYPFSSAKSALDVHFKASMVADGAFHSVEIPVVMLVSTLASHLKYKKHEWVIFAFVAKDKATLLWCNKGPDGTQVWLTVPLLTIIQRARAMRATCIVRAHNHPNSIGKRADYLGPSEADLRSASTLTSQVGQAGMDFIDVVCERGDWLVFCASEPSTLAFRQETLPAMAGLTLADSFIST